MISMSTVHSIRQMRKRGDSISEITRKMGLSRNTVYAKLEEPDLTPPIPMRRRGDRMLDAYRGVISVLARRGLEAVAQAAPRRAKGLAAAARRARRVVQRVHRAPLRRGDAQGAPPGRRRLPRARLGTRRGPGRLRRGGLLRLRRAQAAQLLRAVLPVLQHGVRPGVPIGELGVRLPGPEAGVRARGRGADTDRVRQRHGRRRARARRRTHRRDLRRVLRPLRVRLWICYTLLDSSERD